MLSHASSDYPVTLGSHVSWYPKAERWRIEVADPQTMKAVWIDHRVLARITEVDTRDHRLDLRASDDLCGELAQSGFPIEQQSRHTEFHAELRL